MNITIIGLIAGLLTTFSFLPQIIKMIKTKDVKSISLLMTIIYTVGCSLWLYYGYKLDNIVLLITNSFSFLFGLTMLFLKLKYTKKENVYDNIFNSSRHLTKAEYDFLKITRPMGSEEYNILCEAIKNNSTDKSTLPNRK